MGFGKKDCSVLYHQSRRHSGPFLLVGILTALAVAGVDQGANVLVEARLPLGEWIDIMPMLALYHVHNAGLVLSLFADKGIGIIVVPLIATLIVVVVWVRTHDGKPTTAAAFGLILGGAIGNLIDRALLGYANDFLSIHFEEHILFVFNVADLAVMFGLLLFVYASAFRKRQIGTRNGPSLG